LFEEALAAAKRCGPTETATQLVYLGRYAEASALISKTDYSYIAVASAVATGRWLDAAIAIEADEDLRSRCLGAMFRAFAGETNTFANVSMWIADAECRVMETQTAPVEAQRAKLESLSFDEGKDFFALRRARTLCASSSGGAPRRSYEGYRVNHGAAAEAWFAPFAANAYAGDDAAALALIHEDLLALALVNGDFKQARGELARAATTDQESQLLELAIQLQEGTTEPPLHRYAKVRDWASVAPLLLRIDENASLDRAEHGFYCHSMLSDSDAAARAIDALRAARRGDGAPMLSLLRDCTMSSRSTHDLLLAVLPFVREKRRELVTAIQYQDRDLGYGDDKIPFELIAQLVHERDVARLSGDERRAEQLQGIIDRHAKVLADRRKLVAFYFLADTLW
jgi:hypothetical protein